MPGLSQFSLRTLLIGVTVAAPVIAGVVALYRMQERQELAHRRAVVAIKFKQIATSLHLYGDNTRRLPPPVLFDTNGHPLCSWRYRIWPYVQSPAYEVFSQEPWTSPNNSPWRNDAPPVVCFQENPRPTANTRDTNIFAITGPGTAFDAHKTNSIEKLMGDPATCDTILLVEVRNSKTHWMQPGDFDIRTMPHTINDPAGEGISGTCSGCFCVGFADTEAWRLRNDTPFDKLALFFTIDSARKYDRDVELGPYRVK